MLSDCTHWLLQSQEVNSPSKEAVIPTGDPRLLVGGDRNIVTTNHYQIPAKTVLENKNPSGAVRRIRPASLIFTQPWRW